ncbi:MAG: hypothetical protein U0587_20175 [Candidatus Binatia bacterium]
MDSVRVGTRCQLPVWRDIEMTRRFSLATGLMLALFVGAGCSSPVGIKRVGEQAVYRQLRASELSRGRPSPFSMQFLERLSMADRYQADPPGALARLNAGLGGPDEHDRLFALSELCYAYADGTHDRAYYLAAALYAYAFLFPEGGVDPPIASDPRLRLALDLYNRAIANGLATGSGEEVDLRARRFTLPFGTLDLTANPAGFSYGRGLYRLTGFVSVADLQVRGFRNRYEKPGIGAPLSARVERTSADAAAKRIPAAAKVPVTALVRFDRPRLGLSSGLLKGTIELYDADEVPAAQIDGQSVPLESEPSVTLAYRLEGSPVWDFEIAGFRRGDVRILGSESEGQLYFLAPYHPGRIPIVFVHGTASSPARWAEMANELLSDSRIASRYQIWLFIYNSGNPIGISAMHLREELVAARKEIDPDGADPALSDMVVIGHSQGGLLTKLTVVDSGTRFWDNISTVPFEQATLSPETKDLARRSMFVKPLPFVKRVIFIATPHRGSFLTENILGRIARRLISLPGTITKAGAELVALNPAAMVSTAWHPPTAIDNMDWSHPFLRTLASLPIAAGVHAHSIVPVKGNGPPEEGDDGVVKYTSAHIDGVDSELIVRSGHSTQAQAETIEEVRRILYLHAGIH